MEYVGPLMQNQLTLFYVQEAHRTEVLYFIFGEYKWGCLGNWDVMCLSVKWPTRTPIMEYCWIESLASRTIWGGVGVCLVKSLDWIESGLDSRTWWFRLALVINNRSQYDIILWWICRGLKLPRNYTWLYRCVELYFEHNNDDVTTLT